ncbi:MAG: glutathione S-transferase N-terminal domain-containing protein [Burkholderiaceae bacterium]
MIDLYYWPTSNGRKMTIALEEMELPYNIIPVNMRNGDTTRPEFLRINPNGKIPAMVDHDVAGGLVLFESVAMLQYLAEKSGRLMPREIAARYNVVKWLVFQAANIGPMFGQLAHFHDYAKEKFRYALNRYSREVERLYRVLDTRLGESEYIAGPDYSIADIACWPWIQPSRQEQRFEDWSNLKRWHEQLGSRPALQRGNSVRLDLQGIGAQNLTDEEWNALFSWQQAPRTPRA